MNITDLDNSKKYIKLKYIPISKNILKFTKYITAKQNKCKFLTLSFRLKQIIKKQRKICIRSHMKCTLKIESIPLAITQSN